MIGKKCNRENIAKKWKKKNNSGCNVAVRENEPAQLTDAGTVHVGSD